MSSETASPSEHGVREPHGLERRELRVERLLVLRQVADADRRADPDLALRGLELADDGLQEHALAGAVRADEADALAVNDRQVDIVQDGVVAEAHAQAAELEDALAAADVRAQTQGDPAPLEHRPLDLLHPVDLALLVARLLDVALVDDAVRPVLEAARRPPRAARSPSAGSRTAAAGAGARARARSCRRSSCPATCGCVRGRARRSRPLSRRAGSGRARRRQRRRRTCATDARATSGRPRRGAPPARRGAGRPVPARGTPQARSASAALRRARPSAARGRPRRCRRRGASRVPDRRGSARRPLPSARRALPGGGAPAPCARGRRRARASRAARRRVAALGRARRGRGARRARSRAECARRRAGVAAGTTRSCRAARPACRHPAPPGRPGAAAASTCPSRSRRRRRRAHRARRGSRAHRERGGCRRTCGPRSG